MSLQEQQQQILNLVLQLLLAFLCLIPVVIIIILLIKRNKEYKNSAYYHITKLPFRTVKNNIGRYGEYLTYKCLKSFETSGARFLFNLYIPKENGETTEIDVLMICSKGIFVFESKNYSGWIFGSEEQKNWYQTLPAGRRRSHKEHFYNPIMQNRSHIRCLKALLGEYVPMHSIIVFSDRCTLKSIHTKSDNISVIKRHNVDSFVSDICNKIPTDLLQELDIASVYDKLYPYTQVDDIVKAQHTANIHNMLNPQLTQKSNTSNAFSIPTEPIELSGTKKVQAKDNVSANADMIESIVEVNESGVIDATESQSAEPENLKCPKCNGNLVLRTATRGKNIGKQFYGCSNYPKCKYIQNYEVKQSKSDMSTQDK